MKTWKYSLRVSCLLLAGCSTEWSAGEATSIETERGVILADIELGGQHRVLFIETMPGAVSLSETGIGSAEQSLLAKLGPMPLHEKYAALGVPVDAEVLERLEQAQLRVEALNAEVAELEAQGLAPKTEPPTSTGAIAAQKQALFGHVANGIFPGWDQPAAFEQSWCDTNRQHQERFCAFFSTGYDSGWPGETSYFRSIVLNAGASGTVTHNHVQWVCTRRFLGICTAMGWKVQTTQSVIPGNYGFFEDTYALTRYSANIPATTTIHVGGVWDR